MATILLIAGIGTTRSTMCSTVYRIVTTPGLEENLRDNPSNIVPFIEEVLRLESPVNNVYRRATRDLEIGGVSIPANAIVAISIGAANRDAGTFKCPAELHVDRPNLSRHLAFGHGPHLCLGKDLGRAEVRISLQNMLKRMKNIRLTDGEAGIERALHFFQHSILKLPISFDRM
jgi:cytochrome P450